MAYSPLPESLQVRLALEVQRPSERHVGHIVGVQLLHEAKAEAEEEGQVTQQSLPTLSPTLQLHRGAPS
jgi:hypothetical protein